ncbi:hypothetical protein C2845_PM11G29410 [Panicum miliaceum]|uniref:RBR-type E3 ubiquitin transferase n=1 Tax=Panicum miliaceum TaxID=4540 RepID=A0A3L6RV61_PANMI|nr:hypothetical protein C2845_PM11G29410 [Panicum miliaceum]
MSLEPSSSALAGEVGAGYWAAREEAAPRLEAMAAAARGDDELSEEQFQGNSQIQEDELLALQAIYGDDMVIFDNMDGLRCFQISLHYQLQGDIQMYMNVGTNETTDTGDEGDGEDAADGLLYACSLQHLPPITLTCLLPRSYPSTRAPYFVIAAKWLDEPEVSRFCSVLDEIWAELPRQEVVFRWADWLSGSSWSCIASDDQMVLGPDASSAGADERAIGRSLILDSTIPLMHRYSEERSQETFDQSVHECGKLHPAPVQPFLLRQVHGVLLRHPREGSVTRLACPDTACRAPLPPPVLQRLLGEEGYARWESLELRRTLDTMPDVAYCPRCNAACVAAGDDAQCPACFFTFRAQCGERRHVGDACVPAEDKLDELLERQKLKSSAREEQRSEAQRLREQRKVEELLSLREMVCHNCGKFFCYRCSRAISGYAHFVNGECGLFERVGRGRLPGQQARMDNQDLDDEDVEIKEPGWMRALRYTCPICGAKRTEAGANNLLVCRACQTRYCALCWKRVWEVSQHYGPWGDCQQRS